MERDTQRETKSTHVVGLGVSSCSLFLVSNGLCSAVEGRIVFWFQANPKGEHAVLGVFKKAAQFFNAFWHQVAIECTNIQIVVYFSWSPKQRGQGWGCLTPRKAEAPIPICTRKGIPLKQLKPVPAAERTGESLFLAQPS